MSDPGVRLGVEGASSFRSQINQARASIRQLGAELKLTEAKFRQTGDAEQYLSERSKNLQKQIAEQEKVVEQCQRALEQLQRNGVEQNSKEWQKLALELTQAQTTLVSLKTSINDTGSALRDGKSNADQMRESLEQIQKTTSFKGVMDGINGITDAVWGAIKKVGQLAKALWDAERDAGQWADDLSTRASQYGMTTTELQQWEYASSFFDVDVDTMVKSSDKLRKALMKTDTTFLQVGKEKIEFFGKDGTPRDSLDVLQEFALALGEVDEATADAYSQEIFGKSFRDMKPMIDFLKGGGSLEQLFGEAPVVSEENVQALADMNDSMEKLDKTVETTKLDALAALAPAFQKIAESFTTVVQAVDEYLKSDAGQKMIEDFTTGLTDLLDSITAEDIQNAVQTVAGWISDIASGFSTLVSDEGSITSAIGAIAGALGAITIADGVVKALNLINGLGSLNLLNLGNHTPPGTPTTTPTVTPTGTGGGDGTLVTGTGTAAAKTGFRAKLAAFGEKAGVFGKNLLYKAGQVASRFAWTAPVAAVAFTLWEQHKREEEWEDKLDQGMEEVEGAMEGLDPSKPDQRQRLQVGSAYIKMQRAQKEAGFRSQFTPEGTVQRAEESMAELITPHEGEDQSPAGKVLSAKDRILIGRMRDGNYSGDLVNVMETQGQVAKKLHDYTLNPDLVQAAKKFASRDDALDAIVDLQEVTGATVEEQEQVYDTLDTLIETFGESDELSEETRGMISEYVDEGSGFGAGSNNHFSDAQEVIKAIEGDLLERWRIENPHRQYDESPAAERRVTEPERPWKGNPPQVSHPAKLSYLEEMENNPALETYAQQQAEVVSDALNDMWTTGSQGGGSAESKLEALKNLYQEYGYDMGQLLTEEQMQALENLPTEATEKSTELYDSIMETLEGYEEHFYSLGIEASTRFAGGLLAGLPVVQGAAGALGAAVSAALSGLGGGRRGGLTGGTTYNNNLYVGSMNMSGGMTGAGLLNLLSDGQRQMNLGYGQG